MELLKKGDFIGPNFSFEMNDSPRHKTLQGAILSSITFISACVMAFFFGQEMYQRKRPILAESIESLDNNFIEFDIFPAVFRLLANGEVLDSFEYLDFDLTYMIISDSFISLNPKLVKCKDLDFNLHPIEVSKAVFNYKTDYNLCLNHTDLNLQMKEKEKEYEEKGQDLYVNSEQSTQFVSISVFFCNMNVPNRNCKADEEFFKKRSEIDFHYLEAVPQSSNYSMPIRYDLVAIRKEINRESKKSLRLTMRKNIHETDNGWLLENMVEQAYYTDINTEIITLKENYYDIYTLNFYVSKLKTRNLRSYMKIQELFAKIGGIANAFYLIIYGVSYHYIRFKYLMFVRENTFGFIEGCTDYKQSIKADRSNNINLPKVNINLNQAKEEQNNSSNNEVKEVNLNSKSKTPQVNQSRSESRNLNQVIQSNLVLEKNPGQQKESQTNKKDNLSESINEGGPNLNESKVQLNNYLFQKQESNDKEGGKIEVLPKPLLNEAKETNNKELVDLNGKVDPIKVKELTYEKLFKEEEGKKERSVYQDFSYFSYTSSVVCCCHNETTKYYEKELEKVRTMLDVSVFNRFLIEQYKKYYVEKESSTG